MVRDGEYSAYIYTSPSLPAPHRWSPQSAEQTMGLDSRECGVRNSILSRYFRPFERKSILKSDQPEGKIKGEGEREKEKREGKEMARN